MKRFESNSILSLFLRRGRLIFAMSFIIIPCLAPWLSLVRGETLLFDNFDDGRFTDDQPGTWLSVFGAPLDASSGDLQLRCCGGTVWDQVIDGDVSVQTRAQLVEGNFGIATKFGGGNGNDGYYFGLVPDNSLIFLARVNGVEHPIDLGTTVSRTGNEDVFLQLDVVGNQVSGWYWTESSGPPQAPQLQAALADHPLIQGGSAGFYVTTDSGESLLRYARIANAPIAVPEPTTATIILGAMALLFCQSRRSR